MNGNYQVGVRKYHIKKPGYNGCLVYYPMDRKDFVEQIEKKNTMWMNEYDWSDQIIPILCSTLLPDWISKTIALLPERISKKIGPALFGVLRICQVDCAFEGKLHGDFSSGKKALRPLVFSHGLSARKEHYQGLYKDWASHGYLVVALDHFDNMCISQDWWETCYLSQRFVLRKGDAERLVEMRSDDLLNLIKEVTNNAMFTTEALDAPLAKIDSKELILGGHNFGGAAVLYTSTRLAKEQVKAVWTFDPWMFPQLEEIISGKL